MKAMRELKQELLSFLPRKKSQADSEEDAFTLCSCMFVSLLVCSAKGL